MLKEGAKEREELSKATKKIAQKKDIEKKIVALEKAFELFTEETRRLIEAYNGLKEQFTQTNLALEEKNKELKQTVVELDLITYYLDNILNSITQGLLFIDAEGAVTIYNSAAEELLGVKNEQVLFHPFWQNFSDNFFGFSLKEALKTLAFPPITYITTKLKGKNIDFEISSSQMRKNWEGKGSTEVEITGLIVLIRDVSEMRKLQLLAARNNRMQELGEMAAMVAHEIRNPLGGIKGFAALLERDLATQPSLKEMASYIVQGTDELNRLVSRVLQYARPVHAELAMTDLMLLIKEVEEHIRADTGLSKNNEIISICNSPSAILPLDPHLIRSALFNLIVNSLQAMPNGGTVTITVAVTEEQVIIAISDTGVGIPKENLEKIFTPFFTTKSSGSGFGLSEVYKNIQVHGGSIAVVSQVGQGSTFTIFLPLHPLKYEEGHEKIMFFNW